MVFDVCLGGVPVCHDLRGMAAMPHEAYGYYNVYYVLSFKRLLVNLFHNCLQKLTHKNIIVLKLLNQIPIVYKHFLF